MESTVFKKLKEKGRDVYFPSQKIGECKSPYVVIKGAGGSKFRDNSSTNHYVDILCYVPSISYSTLNDFVDNIKKDIKELYPMLKPTYYESPAFYDDTFKAHMISVQYIYYKKI